MERDYVLLVLLGSSAFLHLISVILGILFYTAGAPFENVAGTLTAKYTTQFSPEEWIYPFWNSVLWIWLTFAFVYLGVNVFRQNKDGKMYCNPPLVTREVACLMSVNAVLQVIWLFVWDSEGLIGTVVILFLLAVTSWATVVVFTIRFWKATPFLFHHTRLDLWIFRVIIQNGLGAYATWVTMEFLLKLSVAATLNCGDEAVDNYPSASAVGIITLNFILAITFPLEMISWEKHLRYMISPIIVVLWVTCSIYVRLEKVQHQDQTMEIYVLVMVVLTTLLFLARSISMVVRHFRNPLVPYV